MIIIRPLRETHFRPMTQCSFFPFFFFFFPNARADDVINIRTRFIESNRRLSTIRGIIRRACPQYFASLKFPRLARYLFPKPDFAVTPGDR